MQEHVEAATKIISDYYWQEKQRLEYLQMFHYLDNIGWQALGLTRPLTRYMVEKIMKTNGWFSIRPRAWKKTTVQDPNALCAEDWIGQDFDFDRVPGTVLCGDITYLKLPSGKFMYFVTVIDLATRRLIGWATSMKQNADLVVSALKDASTNGYVAKNAIFHSDRGCQYTSNMFGEYCSKLQVTPSMGRTGICYDNAVAESFFSTFKNETFHHGTYTCYTDVVNLIIEHIGFYNNRRPHSFNNYLTPKQTWENKTKNNYAQAA